MADNIVKVGVQVSDNGTSAKTTKNVEKLKDVLDQTKMSATAAGKAIGSMSGGGRGPSAAQTRATESQASQSYGVARGAIGTGAEGRDFAKQSQGLGGLVRLYATFAANLFAAEAAFRALSNAMDTSNMVRGLDQLGASSGKNLGSLAKRLVETTDGAVSLREGLEATAKASSAGLNSDQILRLGAVAKTASQALGISMPDALNRLSRGVSKLEPELLDELGIFVRIDDAVRNYALSVGKTASSLTDFERRQAFANAVITQGEQKFNAIKLDANPYSKLAASLANLAQSSLEFINKGLAPLVKLLSESPAALGLAVAFIAKTLLNQAIPALVQWRGNLVSAAEQAKKTALAINTSFGQEYVDRFEKAFKVPDLRAQVKQNEKALIDSAKNISGGQGPLASISKKLSEGQKLTSSDLGATTKLVTAARKELDAVTASGDAKQIAAATKKLASLEAERNKVKELISTYKKLQDAEASVEKEANKPVARFSTEAQNLRIAERAKQRFARLSALSEVSSNVLELGGVGPALDKLRKDIDEKGIKGFNRLRTVATGTFIAASTSVGNFLSAYGPVAAAVTAGAGIIFTVLDSYLSKNARQMEQFKSATQQAQDSVLLVDNTLQQLDTTSFEKAFGVQGTQARANAFEELALSVSKLSSSFNDVVKVSTSWDRFWDSLWDAVGKGSVDVLSVSLAQTVTSALKAMPVGETREQFKQTLSNILQTTDLTAEGVTAAVQKAGSISLEQAGALAKDTSEAISKASTAQKVIAEKLTEGKSAFESMKKAYDELVVSLASTTPLTKFATSIVLDSQSIVKNLKDPNLQLKQLVEIVNDINKLQFITPAQAAQLVANKDKINELAKAQLELQTATIEAEAAQEQLNKNLKLQKEASARAAEEQRGGYLDRAISFLQLGDTGVNLSKQLQEAEAELRKKIQAPIDIELKLKNGGSQLQESLSKLAQASLEDSAKKAAEVYVQQLKISQERARIGVLSTISQGIEGPGKAAITAELKNRELEIQKTSIEATITLTGAVLENKAALEEQTAQLKLTEFRRNVAQSGPDRTKEALLVSEVELAQKRSAYLKLGTKATLKDFQALPPSLQTELISRFRETTGAKEQLSALEGQKKSNILEAEKATRKEILDLVQKDLQNQIDLRDIEINRLNTLTSITGTESSGMLALKQKAENEKISLQNQQALNAAQDKYTESIIALDNYRKQGLSDSSSIVENAEKASKEAFNEVIALQDKQAANSKIKELQDSIALGAKREAEYQDRIIRALDYKQKLLNIDTNITDVNISAEEKSLDLAKSRGIITEEEYSARKKALELRRIDSTTLKSTSDLETSYAKDRLKAVGDLNKAQSALEASKGLGQAQLESERAVEAAQAELDKLDILYNRNKDLIDISDRRAKQGVEELYSISAETQKYQQFFEQSIGSMGDALVDFALTGKQSFGDMIKSMIAGLIKLQFQMQIANAYSSAGGFGGILGSIAGLFTGGSSGAPANIFNPDINYRALGAAYSSGVEVFAKGGAFTNTIVTKPTMFAFAKGAGLMGEAGPEAIMPLKRAPNGSLGVQGGQPAKVDVVVNNYSQAQATTRETQDARGNRKIEVLIGEMAAAELQRPNSPMQNTMRGTFGVTPMLTRR